MKIIKYNHHKQPARRDFFDHWMDEMWDPFGWMDDQFTLMPKVNSRMPSIDMSENEQELKIEADMPGFDPEKIDIEINGNILSLRGKMEHDKEDKNKKYYRRERVSGTFYREIQLPQGINTDKADCEFTNGTLTVSIPKTDIKEAKKLKIKVN